MDKLLGWFAARSAQEQLVVFLLSLALVALLVISLIVRPLMHQREQLIRQNNHFKHTLVEVTQLAERYKRLAVARPSVTKTGVKNLARTIDKSLLEFDLQMKRFQPSASGHAQVRLENVAFSNLLTWLHNIETEEGSQVKDLSITNGREDGLVNASIRVSSL